MGAVSSSLPDSLPLTVTGTVLINKLDTGRETVRQVREWGGVWLDRAVLGGVLYGLVYYWVTKDWNKFPSRGAPYARPTFPFGSDSSWAVFTGKVAFQNMISVLPESLTQERYFGVHMFNMSTLVILDKALAKRVLIKDFDYFVDRQDAFTNVTGTQGAKITEKMMLALKGEEWKKVRAMTSPVFTSGKLKTMFPHLIKIAEQLEEYVSGKAVEREMLEAKEMFGLYTLDSIATSGFGIETNSFKDPDNVFRKTALRMVRAPGTVGPYELIFVIINAFFTPKFVKRALKIDPFPKGTIEFFANIVKKALDHRKATGERRNDIIDLVVDQLKTDGGDVDDDKELILIAQAVIFFFAGFETTSLGLTSIVGCLVLYPEVQDRVRQEILENVGESGEVTFDGLQNMKYLDNVILEGLRFVNFVPFLERVCTKDYKIPDSDYVVKKGEIVQVWNNTMVKDSFANVENFDPENFNLENSPDKFAFFMFGQGPRNCVGMRYALLTVKVALVHVLLRMRLTRCEKTPEKLELDPTNVAGNFKGGVWFRPEILELGQAQG